MLHLILILKKTDSVKLTLTRFSERIENMLVEVKRVNKMEMTVVSSLDVSDTFDKNHRDVMESIRNIESTISTAEFSALFYLDSYKASNGKMNPMYLMTRDGFTLDHCLLSRCLRWPWQLFSHATGDIFPQFKCLEG